MIAHFIALRKIEGRKTVTRSCLVEKIYCTQCIWFIKHLDTCFCGSLTRVRYLFLYRDTRKKYMYNYFCRTVCFLYRCSRIRNITILSVNWLQYSSLSNGKNCPFLLFTPLIRGHKLPEHTIIVTHTCQVGRYSQINSPTLLYLFDYKPNEFLHKLKLKWIKICALEGVSAYSRKVSKKIFSNTWKLY